MSTEVRKTATFVGIALLLSIVTLLAVPSKRKPAVFDDQGQPFYPEWTDVTAAASLEVFTFNETTATTEAFKVEQKDGVWRIPSANNYPADAKDRLARTAAALIDLKKEKVWSDDPKDHEKLGVIDPLAGADQPLKGRGQRIAVRDAQGRVLADYIVGKKVEGKPSMRYVRIPGKKRTYAVTWTAEVSTRFSDWIETDLLKLSRWDIKGITINRYQVDERRGVVVDDPEGDTVLVKKDGTWTMEGLGEDEELNTEAIERMEETLDNLVITGVHPIPRPLTQRSLAARGFFYEPKQKRLYANQGEFQVLADPGIRYTILFGEVIAGTGMESERDPSESAGEGPAPPAKENRFVLITVRPDYSILPPIEEEKPVEGETEEQRKEREEKAKKKREELKKKADERAAELNRRFGDWYFVISDESYRALRADRATLVKKKEKKAESPNGTDSSSQQEKQDEQGN